MILFNDLKLTTNLLVPSFLFTRMELLLYAEDEFRIILLSNISWTCSATVSVNLLGILLTLSTQTLSSDNIISCVTPNHSLGALGLDARDDRLSVILYTKSEQMV